MRFAGDLPVGPLREWTGSSSGLVRIGRASQPSSFWCCLWSVFQEAGGLDLLDNDHDPLALLVKEDVADRVCTLSAPSAEGEKIATQNDCLPAWPNPSRKLTRWNSRWRH